MSKVIKLKKTNLLFLALILLTFGIIYNAFVDIKHTIIIIPSYILLLYYYFNQRRLLPKDEISLPPRDSYRNVLYKELLEKIPLGIMVLGKNKNIIYNNKYLKKENISLLEDQVKQELDTIPREGKEYSVSERNFVVRKTSLEKTSKIRKRPLHFLCFEDITEKKQLKTRLKEEQVAVLYIQVDNFDEIVSACSEENRPELLAKVDKTITQWVQSQQGLIKKYSNDKFIAIMSLSDLEKVLENKFDILETIKDIKTATNMMVTLSIGVSYSDSNLANINKKAQDALELCLGRGGDQVVVKTEGKTLFFGGKSKEVEKYSRVRVRVISHVLKDLIEESDKVFIQGHIFLDMDALGAAVGLLNGISKLGKTGYIVISPKQSPSVDSLMELLLKDEDMKKSFILEDEVLSKMTRKSLLIVVDTHKPSLTLSRKVLDAAERVVVIDHHRRSEEFIDKALLVYLEPYASSTSEMVTEILQYIDENLKVSSLAATALLAGITVDTKNFAFKTGVRTFEAASFLRRNGADPTTVYKLFQEDKETVNARSEVVKKAGKVHDNIALSYYDQKPKNPQLSAAQAANSLLEIKGIEASFVIVPYDGGMAISARSLGNINVQRVMEKLGGGGHITVAGAQLKNESLEKAIKKVKQAILEYIEEGEEK